MGKSYKQLKALNFNPNCFMYKFLFRRQKWKETLQVFILYNKSLKPLRSDHLYQEQFTDNYA